MRCRATTISTETPQLTFRTADPPLQLDVREVPQGRQVVVRYTVEIEGQAKPACVAESIVLVVL